MLAGSLVSIAAVSWTWLWRKRWGLLCGGRVERRLVAAEMADGSERLDDGNGESVALLWLWGAGGAATALLSLGKEAGVLVGLRADCCMTAA